MTKYYEGQEVEVTGIGGLHIGSLWRKAKIVAISDGIQSRLKLNDLEVQFSDGSHAVIDAEHIKLAGQSDETDALLNILPPFGNRRTLHAWRAVLHGLSARAELAE